MYHTRMYQLLKFADDAKCFNHIKSVSDKEDLQDNITALFAWSQDNDLNFNIKKFIHLSFKRKFHTTYSMSDSIIPHVDSHKDLGVILSEDLSWEKHHKTIIARAYRTLGLIRRTFVCNHSPTTLVRLYVSLVRSQLLYCTQIWRPHLIKDIVNLERIQRRATKHILNDYTSCYKDRLINLKLLPLIYIFELQDILFAIKSLKSPTYQFNINNFISFNSSTTRAGASNKLLIPQHLNNTARHSYFHRLPSLWNAMPIMDINTSYSTLKSKLKSFLWNHFLTNFDESNNCTFHFLCPCRTCHQSRPPVTNFKHL